MKIYDISRLPSSITLGWDGENNWRPIAFDCTALLTGHPDAVVTLWLLPKGEAQAFPVALERDSNTVTWTPLSEEMTAEHGQLQITVQDGTDAGKSKVVDYTVHDSLVGGADHPAETPSWATQVVADVTEQADRAEEAAESIGEQLPGAIADYLEEHPVTVTETDPTVPSWAKQPQKPTYTAAEVHALPDSTAIPTKTSDLQNDSGFLTQHQSLAAYRTASAQDTIDAAQDTAIAGKYTKPSTGIPASDLASAVQTSLGKADTALQEHQSLAGYATETYVQQQIDAIPDELPAVSAADNDKFLRVADGAWTAEAGDEYDAYSALPSDTASGAIASFPDGADDAPVKSLVAQIAPVQSGSGDPSPTNIRPISGWTGATVTRAGKNLLPNVNRTVTSNGVTFTKNDDGSISLSGATTSRRAFYNIDFNNSARAFNLVPFWGKQVCVSISDEAIPGVYLSFGYFKEDGSDAVRAKVLTNAVTTIPNGAYWGRTFIAVEAGTILDGVTLYPQVELGSTATDYEPYQGNTYNITFPSEAGTVYGGTLDVANGVLTVTKGLIPSYSGEALPGEWISSMDVYAQGVTPTTGAQVCYDLASPITYQLDPVTVTTLLGVNNIWADTGDVAVDYRADTGLYIQKLTGSTEEDMIADAPIASGKYFLVGNTLYLSTAAIAAGATLTPGTNCVKTNLAEALNALNKTETVPSAESNSFGGGS